MKKVFKTASLVACGLLIALSSCKKADEATPVEKDATVASNYITSEYSTATIEGKVFYDNDLTNNTDADDINTDIPVGAIVTITADYTVENSGDVTEGTITKTVIIGTDGTYSVDMPAEVDGTTVTIKFEQYKGLLKKDIAGDDEEEEGYYESFETDVTIFPGLTELVSNQFYNSNTFESLANPSKF